MKTRKAEKEIDCPKGCGFYAYEGSEGRDEMNAHLKIDCEGKTFEETINPAHTPSHSIVPFHVDDVSFPNKTIIRDRDNSWVAEVTPEDAAFIVRAVNAHADLLEALKMLILEATHFRNTGKGEQFLSERIVMAQQAIHRAEKGE